MTDDADNIENMSGLQLGRALVREMTPEKALLFLHVLKFVKECGKGEVRLNVMDGQITTAQPCPIFKTDEQFRDIINS